MDLLLLILTPAVFMFGLGYWLGRRHQRWITGQILKRGAHVRRGWQRGIKTRG